MILIIFNQSRIGFVISLEKCNRFEQFTNWSAVKVFPTVTIARKGLYRLPVLMSDIWPKPFGSFFRLRCLVRCFLAAVVCRGYPQWGQAIAWSLTCRLHSGHLINMIIIPFLKICIKITPCQTLERNCIIYLFRIGIPFRSNDRHGNLWKQSQKWGCFYC